MQGAEIYATVGSETKAQYLQERFGISRHRMFNSRDSSFRDGIMRQTEGKGVDIVINSLAGELLHASWECVAKFGKMIEIGKKDIMGNGSLRLAPFLHNRSFVCISMDEIMSDRPELNLQYVLWSHCLGALAKMHAGSSVMYSVIWRLDSSSPSNP